MLFVSDLNNILNIFHGNEVCIVYVDKNGHVYSPSHQISGEVPVA